MKKLALSFLSNGFFLFGSLSLAHVGGAWSGVGFARDGEGWSSECPFVFFELRENHRRFTISSGNLNCDGRYFHWLGSSFNIRDGALWIHEEKAGDVLPNGFLVHFDAGLGRTTTAKFETQGAKLFYSERMVDSYGDVVFEANAELLPIRQ